jgi:glutathione S-transferase
MLKLYHWWSSTCSRRVRIGLAEKKLEWESVYVNLRKSENLEPWYVKLNPNGVVPTLDHDGRIIIESNFILEYLDDVCPGVPLRPEDPYERARMRIWMDKFEHVLHRNINVISFIKQGRIDRFKHLCEKELQAAIDRQPTEAKRVLLARRLRKGISEEEMTFAEDRLSEVLDEMEQALKDR